MDEFEAVIEARERAGQLRAETCHALGTVTMLDQAEAFHPSAFIPVEDGT